MPREGENNRCSPFLAGPPHHATKDLTVSEMDPVECPDRHRRRGIIVLQIFDLLNDNHYPARTRTGFRTIRRGSIAANSRPATVTSASERSWRRYPKTRTRSPFSTSRGKLSSALA